MQEFFHPTMTRQELLAMSALALAHVGDGVFVVCLFWQARLRAEENCSLP